MDVFLVICFLIVRGMKVLDGLILQCQCFSVFFAF